MTKLEDLLDAVDQYKQQLYAGLLVYHNNERLRQLVKENSDRGIELMKTGAADRTTLYFQSAGFAQGIQYHSKYNDYKEQNHKLITSRGGAELLAVFPRITPQLVEKRVLEAISQYPLVRRVITIQQDGELEILFDRLGIPADRAQTSKKKSQVNKTMKDPGVERFKRLDLE